MKRIAVALCVPLLGVSAHADTMTFNFNPLQMLGKVVQSIQQQAAGGASQAQAESQPAATSDVASSAGFSIQPGVWVIAQGQDCAMADPKAETAIPSGTPKRKAEKILASMADTHLGASLGNGDGSDPVCTSTSMSIHGHVAEFSEHCARGTQQVANGRYRLTMDPNGKSGTFVAHETNGDYSGTLQWVSADLKFKPTHMTWCMGDLFATR